MHRIIAVVLGVVIASAGAEEPAAEKIKAAIQDLSSEEFARREAGERALINVGAAAQSAIEKAQADSKDEEVRTRASRILAHIRNIRELDALTKDQRTVAELPFKFASRQEAGTTPLRIYGWEKHTLLDMPGIRIAFLGRPCKEEKEGQHLVGGGWESLGTQAGWTVRTEIDKMTLSQDACRVVITDDVIELAEKKEVKRPDEMNVIVFLDDKGKLIRSIELKPIPGKE